jgi:hypothetical protein
MWRKLVGKLETEYTLFISREELLKLLQDHDYEMIPDDAILGTRETTISSNKSSEKKEQGIILRWKK